MAASRKIDQFARVVIARAGRHVQRLREIRQEEKRQ
jgi:hypothetical protein